MFVRILLFTVLTFLANSNQLLFAQLPAARLLNVTPAGARAGSSIEVVVAGTDLDDLKGLRFSRPGINASLKGTNRFEVTIAAEVPPGVYDVRAVGKYGASNPRTFAVGVLNEVAEDKNSSDSPQTVALESTINGRSDANTIDYFRFNAKKAQRVLARCETRALNSRLEPVLVLYDSDGREVNRVRSGGFLEYSIPEDGEFTLRLHDAIYRGGVDFFYRLSIGTFPHIDYMLPVAGETGEGVKFAVYGRNLPGGKSVDAQAKPALERVEVELTRNNADLSKPQTTIPAQAGLGLHEYRIRSGRGASDGALLLFPTATVVSEDEPNNTPAAARKIALPCEVTGQFFPNGDRDWFSFDAKKGDVYWIEVISHRLGLPTDPFVLVQRAGTNGSADVLELNDSEANVGGPEFNTTHRDPAGRFEAKENGTYRLQVRDLFTQPRSNPALVYQLVIRKPAPDFRLAAWPATPLPVKKDGKDIPVGTTTLRREEVMPIKVLALRRDGFDSAIDLSVPELPAGLLAATARIEAGKNSTLLFVSGKSNCAPTVAALKIQGTAMANGTNVMRAAIPISLLWPVADPAADVVQSRSSAEYVVSTVDEMFPVRLTAAEEKTWEATAGSKLKIPLKLNVEGELSANLKLKPVGVAGLESAKEFDLDPKSTNTVYEIDLSQQKLSPGTYTFALQGLATVKPVKAAKDEKKPAAKERTFTLYSTPITLKVNPAPTNSVAK